MPGLHLTLDLLRAVHQGARSPRDLAIRTLAHLLELCPHCQEIFDEWCRDGGPDVRTLERQGGEEASCEAVREPGEMRHWLDEILKLPETKRIERVHRDSGRSRDPRLIERLLTEARSYLPTRLRDVRAIAGLARTLLQHGSASRETAILYALAVAEEGNAARALGEVEAAEDLLESARFLLRTEGCDDSKITAVLDKQEGTLRRYQGRLMEAEALLGRAAAAFSRAGETEEAARALLALGLVFYDRRDFERAAELARQTIEPLQVAGDLRVLLCARHNLAAALCEDGQAQEAREAFDATQDLYDQEEKDGIWPMYRSWLDGNLSRREGNFAAAESRLREARQACLAQRMEYRAAVVGKDLASLLAEQGRVDELERLVREIIPVFEAQNVHYEADIARQILQQATQAGPSVH